MSRVKRREDIFYSLLNEFGDKVVATATLYKEIIDRYPSSINSIARMRDMEQDCDSSVAKIMSELAQSFITPFDREDLAALAHAMDDVVDSMYGAIERLYIFHVEEMRPEVTHIAQITVESVDEMRTMLAHLPHFHHEKHLMDYVLHIDDLEDKGDDTYHDALSHLFAGGVDPIEVIR